MTLLSGSSSFSVRSEIDGMPLPSFGGAEGVAGVTAPASVTSFPRIVRPRGDRHEIPLDLRQVTNGHSGESRTCTDATGLGSGRSRAMRAKLELAHKDGCRMRRSGRARRTPLYATCICPFAVTGG